MKDYLDVIINCSGLLTAHYVYAEEYGENLLKFLKRNNFTDDELDYIFEKYHDKLDFSFAVYLDHSFFSKSFLKKHLGDFNFHTVAFGYGR